MRAASIAATCATPPWPRWGRAVASLAIRIGCIVGMLWMPVLVGCGDDSHASAPSQRPISAAAETRALLGAIPSGGPGCAVVVVQGERPIFSAAVGQSTLDPSRPLTVDTAVDIASTAKQFTAVAVLRLVDRGVVGLNTPLSRYISELPAPIGSVTVGQALHHQSGIPDYVGLLASRLDDRVTNEDALRALIAAHDLEFKPGSQFRYSNSNYLLLGQVVERASGMSLARFLTRKVLAPAGVTARFTASSTSRSYRTTGGAWIAADPPWQTTGDGGMWMSPRDLARWAAQYWEATISGESMTRLMLRDAVATPIGRYGAGIVEARLPDGSRVLGHDGRWGGYTTAFVVLPDERRAIVMTCNGLTADGLPVGGIDVQRLIAIWHDTDGPG